MTQPAPQYLTDSRPRTDYDKSAGYVTEITAALAALEVHADDLADALAAARADIAELREALVAEQAENERLREMLEQRRPRQDGDESEWQRARKAAAHFPDATAGLPGI
jgi:septal ring factor EnvC (AmiA/AmiB activator)